jgi:lipopolysaccharide transport system ATP-binding protein
VGEIAIRVQNLIKDYEIYAKPMDLAVELLTRRQRHQKFRVLDDISFDVKRGEVFGIIGSNGAGKSTLLKIITGVLDPTAGRVDTEGRISAILELGLGFNPEYSGRENIYLSGLLYGMERDEIDRKLESIIDFSGLSEFIDRPVKTYSSGMHSRLAFSVASAVDPEILIIDEALAAGDSMFVQKCLRRIRELCSGGRTALLVSHGTSLLAQLCSRVMWLERGVIKHIGSALSVIQAYDLAAHQGADSNSWIETIPQPSEPPETGSAPTAQEAFLGTKETGRQVFRRGPILIDNIRILNDEGAETTKLVTLKRFTIEVCYHCEGPLPTERLGVAVAVNRLGDLAPVFQWFTQDIMPTETRETYDLAEFRRKPAPKGTLVLEFPYMPLQKGEYILSLGLLPNVPSCWEFYEYRHFYYKITVDSGGLDIGAPIIFKPNMRSSVDGASQATLSAAREKFGAEDASAPEVQESFASSTTLNAEIHKICFERGHYPVGWHRHPSCPCCGDGKLVDAFSKYGLSHRRCVECHFVCVDPYPPEKVTRELYAGAYYTGIREFYEMPRARDRGAHSAYTAPADLLRAVVTQAAGSKSEGRWLDVGGGIGAFANLIRRMLPGWDVTLNEFNPRSLEIARELFSVATSGDNPKILMSRGEVFDVISAISVLEHIPEPIEFLKSYAELLVPGGCLVVVVPQFSQLNADVSKGASPNVVPPFHVSLFRESNLRLLLERIGSFDEIAIEQAGPAAFSLIEHVDFSDYWDVSVPSAQSPEPRSIKLRDYPPGIQSVLNALDAAKDQLSDYFAAKDGRLYLVAVCKRSGNL